MLNGLFTHYASEIFIGAVLAFALTRAISSGGKSRRKEKPDLPAVFGPIRGMYVCYQCDTVFNTAQCPGCREEALIPLIHLTGSIEEDGRVVAVAKRLSARVNSKRAPLQNEQVVQPSPASLPESSNGGGAEVPVRFLIAPQRRGELS